jgi:hypothetical protein
MNIFTPVPPGAAREETRDRKPGSSLIAGFTWTDLIAGTLLAIALAEFIHY